MLNYMATCRYADKKLHDNTLKMPNVTHIADSVIENGGIKTISTISNYAKSMNNLIEAATAGSRFASEMAKHSNVCTPVKHFAMPEANISAAVNSLTAPIGKGKAFAPLSGNWL